MKALIFTHFADGRAEVTEEARVLSVAAHALAAIDAVTHLMLTRPEDDQTALLAGVMAKMYRSIAEIYKPGNNCFGELFTVADKLHLNDVCTTITEVIQ